MVRLAKTVMRSSIYNSISTFINKLGGLIFTIILARLLAPELFGIFHLVLSIAFLLLSFTDLGTSGTLIKYVSQAVGQNDEISARSYLRYIFRLRLIFNFSCSLFLILLADPIAVHVFHKPYMYIPLIICGFFLFITSLLDFISALFVSLQKFEYLIIKHTFYELTRILFVPLLIILGYGVHGALWGLVIASIVTLVISIFLFGIKYRSLWAGEVICIQKRGILRFLSYMSFASISGIVFAYVDSIMLGIFLPAEYVGIYRAAYNVVFAFIGIISIAFVLFPIFTQLDGLELENAFKRVFRYSSILVFPITFGLIFFAEPVVRIVYGVDYMPSVTPMYALSILIILTPLDFFGILFTAKGKPEFPAKLMIVSSAINIILNYIFIVNLGVLGAAIATVVSRSFNIVILGILSKRILNIAPNLDSIYKPLFSSAIMGLFLYLVPAPSTFLLSIFEILVGVFIYLTTLILLRGLMREDLVFLIETIR